MHALDRCFTHIISFSERSYPVEPALLSHFTDKRIEVERVSNWSRSCY